jgi:hypothetical protein
MQMLRQLDAPSRAGLGDADGIADRPGWANPAILLRLRLQILLNWRRP